MRINIHTQHGLQFFMDMPCRLNINDHLQFDNLLNDRKNEFSKSDWEFLTEGDWFVVIRLWWYRDEKGIYQEAYMSNE